MALCVKGVARAKVRALNGKPSVLYNDLLKQLGDRTAALEMYAKYSSENFEKIVANEVFDKDVNNEATAEFVIKTINDNWDLRITNDNIEARNEPLSTNPKEDKYEESLMFSPDRSANEINDNSNNSRNLPDLNSEEVTTETTGSRQLTDLNDDTEVGDNTETSNFNKTVDEFNDNLRKLASLNNMNAAKESPSNSDTFVGDDEIEITRRNNFVRALNKSAEVTSIRLSSVRSQIRTLMLDRENNKEELGQLFDESIVLSKKYGRNLADIANITKQFESKAIIINVMGRLNKVKAELEAGNLNMFKLDRIGREIKVWLDSYDILSTPEDSQAIKLEMKRLQSYAELIDKLFVDKTSEVFTEIVKTNSSELQKGGKEMYDALEEFNESEDVWLATAYTHSIDRYGIKAMQVLDKMVRDGHMRMMVRVDAFDKQIDEAFKDIKDGEVFRETYEDGTVTGSIVHYISPEFREVEDKFDAEIASEGGKAIDKYASKLQFIKDNKLILDPRILFANEVDETGESLFSNNSVTKEEIADHKARLIEHLGGDQFAKDEFEVLKARLKEQIDSYAMGLESVKRERPTNSNKEDLSKYERNLAYYIQYNSPYVAAIAIDNAAPQMLSEKDHGVNRAVKDLPSIPRRYKANRIAKYSQEVDVKSSETNNYSKDFSKITNDPNLYKAYRFYTSRMHYLTSMLPDYLNFNVNDNYLAMIDKSFLQIMRDGGSKSDELSSRITNLYASNKGANVAFDSLTGKTKLVLNVSIINQNKAEIESAVKQEMLKQEARGKVLNIDEQFEIRRAVTADIVATKSFDIKQILKIFNYQIENYMHKAAKEDSVRAVKDILYSARERKIAKGGKIESRSADSSFTNLKAAFDYYEEVFYGYDRTDDGHNKKVYDAKDKRTLAEIKSTVDEIMNAYETAEISEEERDIRLAAANALIDQLGKQLSSNQALKSVLRYVQVKGMGYNYGAAVTNMFQGYFANLIESKDGRIFNTKQLLQGYKEMGGSVARFYTGGLVNTDTAEKIYNLTRMYDLIGQVSSELEFSKEDTKNMARWKDVYVLQNSSEYFNQSPVVIATMLNTKLKHIVNGKEVEISLWDAVNKDGRLREDLDIVDRTKWDVTNSSKSGKGFTDTMIKATQSINAIHGNYNKLTPTLMNSNVWLKGVKQFKTWLFEAAAQRLEKGGYDEALGMRRKGRWRSGALVLTYAIPEGGNDRVLDHLFKNSLYVTGQLGRRLLFLNTKGIDAKFSEVDAANIRKNIAETIILTRLMLVGYVMTMMLKGAGDDKDKELSELSRNLIRYYINTANRLVDDLLMFVSPVAAKGMVGGIVPAFTLINDVVNFNKGIYHLMTGEVTETGVYAGEKAYIREITSAMPFTSKIHSTRASAKQLFTGQR